MNYRIIPLDSCLELAQSLAVQHRRWHSHALTPGCTHNPYADYAIVIEDDTDHRAFIAPSTGYPEVDKELVRLLHGDDILDPESTAATTGEPINSTLLERVREINGRSEPWHHHMCFPDCAFNEQRGKWTIVLESEGGRLWESWEQEPANVLREIEVLYFGESGPDL